MFRVRCFLLIGHHGVDFWAHLREPMRPTPMQQISAFSRPQTVPAVPTSVPKRNLWILSSWRDLILYVGTPLLLVPMFALAQARWSAQDIYVFVAAFGAMGHHLPGMIRAYGDRALFERFRWRFIFAPLFLLATCVAFYWWDLKGIVLVVFFWGVWHGMMQTYGFCRIYDAKTGSFAALTRRLDFATCGIWFAAAVLLSPQRMTDTLEAFYGSGGPFLSAQLLRMAQQALLFTAIAVSILFVVNFIRQLAAGSRPNPVKLALLVTSIAFWWYCNNGVANILAGIALFEVFHDVQYLSLVWIYNRNRVEKDSSIGGFMRFVFRRSGALVGLYIGLVFAYGSLGYFNSRLEVETIKRVLTGMVAASSLLHFYYDGFIWKVREKATRESLGLTGGTTSTASNELLPSWMLHGLKWVAVFVIPLGALFLGQLRGSAPETERERLIVATLPIGARQHLNYGFALEKAGRFDEALDQYRIALSFDPNYAKVHVNMANVLMGQSKVEAALGHFEKAARLESGDADHHFKYAYALERLGRTEEAGAEYVAAVKLKPRSPQYHYAWAMHLLKVQRFDEAGAEFEQVLRLDPKNADAHFAIGNLASVNKAPEEAERHYLEAARLDGKTPDIRSALGDLYFQQGRVSQAIVQYEEALRLNPGLRSAEENLRLAKASDARFQP
jgi:tetratricopeptide (TPR) repeat protein/branched-subunit amino acid transport protein